MLVIKAQSKVKCHKQYLSGLAMWQTGCLWATTLQSAAQAHWHSSSPLTAILFAYPVHGAIPHSSSVHSSVDQLICGGWRVHRVKADCAKLWRSTWKGWTAAGAWYTGWPIRGSLLLHYKTPAGRVVTTCLSFRWHGFKYKKNGWILIKW